MLDRALHKGPNMIHLSLRLSAYLCVSLRISALNGH
jgi:hypothetical protein